MDDKAVRTVEVPASGDYPVLDGRVVPVTTRYVSNTEALCTRTGPSWDPAESEPGPQGM